MLEAETRGGLDGGKHALLPFTVIGSVYIQQRWLLVNSENEHLGRALDDAIGGTGALVAGIYRLCGPDCARLVTALGRDPMAEKVHQWCQRLGIDLFSTIVAAPTGKRCLIKLADQWEMPVMEPGANSLLSISTVEELLQERKGSIFISMDMGAHLVERILQGWSNQKIYVSVSSNRLSDYHLLSRAYLVLLTREHLGELWGRPIVHRNDAESAVKALSYLGIARMSVCLSRDETIVYEKGEMAWISEDRPRDEWVPVSPPSFEYFVGGVIAALERGTDLMDAIRIGLQFQNQMCESSQSWDEVPPFGIAASELASKFLLVP